MHSSDFSRNNASYTPYFAFLFFHCSLFLSNLIQKSFQPNILPNTPFALCLHLASFFFRVACTSPDGPARTIPNASALQCVVAQAEKLR
jgi:hypothetical protein